MNSIAGPSSILCFATEHREYSSFGLKLADSDGTYHQLVKFSLLMLRLSDRECMESLKISTFKGVTLDHSQSWTEKFYGTSGQSPGCDNRNRMLRHAAGLGIAVVALTGR